MSTDSAFARRAHEEDWLPTLELAILEVFEIMMGCKVKASTEAASLPKGGFTAIVGLAGALCGVVTVCCSAETAGHLAKAMLEGDAADSEDRWWTRWEKFAT